MLLQLDGAQGEIHAKYMQLRCLKRKEVKRKEKRKEEGKEEISGNNKYHFTASSEA